MAGVFQGIRAVFSGLRLGCALIIALVVVGGAVFIFAPESRPFLTHVVPGVHPSLRYARAVADAFLNDALGRRENLRENSTADFDLRLPRVLPESDFPADGKPGPFTSWTINSEALSTDGNEALFGGTLNGSRTATFDLRVVKEGDKWRVGYFSYRPQG